MLTETLTNNHNEHEEHHDGSTNSVFGFWIYILSDCVLFATLFAGYTVLHNNIYGGPSAKELFSMPFVLTETFILLTSSFTYGLAMLASHKKNKSQVLLWLFITFLLGLSFVGMEIHEFSTLIEEGNSFSRSAFLSSFFTLVGTHGLHVTYIIGFILSIILTVIPYYLVVNHILASEMSYIVISVFAILQLLVQLVFFLHLGGESKPHWNLIAFVFTLFIIGILVTGSLWIMYNLNYNMVER